jgi:uncharacterized repeat protein (TIGR02543 family)
LKPESFTRAGYTFKNWNTAASGSGDSYANDTTYSFVQSATLYAQWKKIKKIDSRPVVPSAGQIGPFAQKSSVLSTALDSLVQDLAHEVKAKKISKINLSGFGDALSTTQTRSATLVAANVALGQERAQSVAIYLEGQLSALGLKGWTISISASDSSLSESGFVAVTLS